jgi:hypothetical protein
VLALGFAWALWTARVRPRAWVVICALQAVLLGAGLVAMNTGEHEEDRVESVVPEAAISRHEAYAEQFVWASGVTLALAGLVLVFRRPTAMRVLTVASFAGTLVVAGAALRVGHAGGQLVYVHNAGAAYASGAGTGSQAPEPSPARPLEKSHPGDDGDR